MTSEATVRKLVELAPPELSTLWHLSHPFWVRLSARYSTPPRAYHNLNHVLSVVEEFYRHRTSFERPLEAYLALLFHDAVYVPGRSDNETMSASLAREELSGVASELGVDVEHVAHLIELTARHGEQGSKGLTPDEALFLDCDMAVLGAAPDEYDRYARAIRSEHDRIPDEVFQRGRSALLSALLQSPRIYLSERFLEDREAQARHNLLRELESLLP